MHPYFSHSVHMSDTFFPWRNSDIAYSPVNQYLNIVSLILKAVFVPAMCPFTCIDISLVELYWQWYGCEHSTQNLNLIWKVQDVPYSCALWQ
jgi:hypothetical protein